MDLDPIAAEQQLYARWLDWGARAGFGALLAGFLAYALGWIEPHVPLERLPQLWALPVDRYLAASGSPAGWGWLRLAARGDYLILLAVAWLALTTIACCLRIAPPRWRRGERLLALIALAQALVLIAAAAGGFAVHR
jgi:hypothetical protein